MKKRFKIPLLHYAWHEGYIVGKERLLTAVSGTFRWPQERKPQVLVFDVTGRPVAAQAELKQTDKGWEVMLKLDDWESVGVVE